MITFPKFWVRLAQWEQNIALFTRYPQGSHSVIPITFAAKYEHLEIIGFDIVNLCPKLRVFVIYRPPHYSSQEATHNEMLIRCLYEHRNIRYSHVVVGDFNLPKIDWNTMCCPNDHVSKPFLDLFVVCGYSQLVNFSTRGNKVLDLILTDDDLLIHNIEPCPPIGCSDHICMKFFIDTSVIGKSAVQSGIPHVCTHYKWAAW